MVNDEATKGFCRHVQNPLPTCYCIDMDSRKVEKAVHYCMGDFEECPIYRALNAMIPGDSQLALLLADADQ